MKTNPFLIDAYEELSAYFEQSLGISSSDRKPNSIVEFASRLSEKLGLSFVGGEFPARLGGVAESRGGRNRVPATRIRRKTQSYMNLPFNPALKERAKKLRKAGNLSEVLFWNQVKNKRFKGFDFDRQKIVGNYIVDFYCSNCDVVIEIDGSSHDNKQEYDARRDAFLESLGLTVVHILVSDVLKNMSAVMAALFDHPALAGTPPGEGNFSSEGAGEVTPANILDYIYAVWHSKGFRERTIDVREMDFSEFPCPEDKEKFWRLVELGREIRLIQALDADVENDFISGFPIVGNNLISQPRFLKENFEYGMGRVYINENQYFDNVPEEVWQCRIGGIFPAQKWLSERENCVLERGDILLYQKIIAALKETLRVMKEIDGFEVG